MTTTPLWDVLVAGGTGLVGRQLLSQLLGNERTGTVHVLLRRAVLGLPASRRLRTCFIDFAAPGTLPPTEEAYIALGTTIDVAGSQAAFRAIDLDAVVNVARAARAAGVRRLAFVSALGADPASSSFYCRVKGEAEAALAGIGFDRLLIARPSLLSGRRSALGQPDRVGERFALAVLRPFRPVLPLRWRPIEANVVARAMVRGLRADGPAVQILESADLVKLGSSRGREA
jgi:uncharacterized protein YbjT (DUF2867 family)